MQINVKAVNLGRREVLADFQGPDGGACCNIGDTKSVRLGRERVWSMRGRCHCWCRNLERGSDDWLRGQDTSLERGMEGPSQLQFPEEVLAVEPGCSGIVTTEGIGALATPTGFRHFIAYGVNLRPGELRHIRMDLHYL